MVNFYGILEHDITIADTAEIEGMASEGVPQRAERYELHGRRDFDRSYGSINSSLAGSSNGRRRRASQSVDDSECGDDEQSHTDRQGILMQDEEDDEESDGPTEEFCMPSTSTAQVDMATFFKDGLRKIDFVLVYEENAMARAAAAAAGAASVPISGGGGGRRAGKHETWRQRFMANLKRVGLDMEEEVVEASGRKVLCFIKLHAPWPVLCHYAEELNMRAPLQKRSDTSAEAHPNPSVNWSQQLLKILRLPNIMYEDVPNKPLDYYTCPFRKSKIEKFLGHDNRATYFTNVQRSRILYEILSTAVFGKKKKGEVGVDRLVEEGVFSAAFPLHDGPYEIKNRSDLKDTSKLNARQVLYEYWARWGKWYKYQPLDHIREYFGEKIAIYFAWLGFYTGWLLPAAIVGLLVFMYGVFTIHKSQPAIEVCDSQGQFSMCPLCDENIGCKFWDLSDVCGYARLAYLFDHPGTVFYAVFVSFWAVTFLEYWKRKSASLSHHWDCMGFKEEEERPRPEFAARAPFLEKNPVTGIREPSFPSSLRTKRIAAGIGIIFLMMSLVIIFILAVIIYRVLVSIPLFQNATFRSQAQAIANVTGAVVNLILIMAMSRVYEKLAYRLTTWEMHRTQTEFDDNLTFKVFIFQFVNFYSSIFYIAFFKGRFVGYPGNYSHILRLRNEDCSAGGCLIELAQQLAVIMIGKQIINNAQEIIVPKLKAWWMNKRVKITKKHKSRWQEDFQLITNEGLFQEYLEMVLQFGFITIFVAAFPLAPLFALLNNWVEIRLDAQKFVCETRRTVAERAENIGIWCKILHMLAHLAVISNGFLIAFTSEFLPKLMYQYEYDWELRGYINFTLAHSPNGTLSQPCRYRGFRDEFGNHTPFFWRLLAVRFAFVIIFEHVVFGICRLIDILVPDIPESLELKIKRERYLAKQALQESDNILKVAAFKGETDDDEGTIPNGRMALDLTSDLGGHSSHDDTLATPISVVVHSELEEAGPSKPKSNEKADKPVT
ncbi:anoctamin-7-like isoform X2 [Cloeon dipterum]|uniref:anoctamin-7-like isoform X2 n=1 Tax=Cloeon dipterum TaxID=197152 RepID=UPI00321F8279